MRCCKMTGIQPYVLVQINTEPKCDSLRSFCYESVEERVSTLSAAVFFSVAVSDGSELFFADCLSSSAGTTSSE